MRDKTGIIESLIEKRREQEEIIAKQLAAGEEQKREQEEVLAKQLAAEEEQRREREANLKLLKDEEKAIRNKDAELYNSLRCDFLGKETFPKHPLKEYTQTVVKESKAQEANSKEVNLQEAKVNEPTLKELLKGASLWFVIFGGIISLAGLQTLIVQLIEGGIRNGFVWVMLGLGALLLALGIAHAWRERQLIIGLSKQAPTTEEVTETEVVVNENYQAEYEAYKNEVFALYKENLRRQGELKKQEASAAATGTTATGTDTATDTTSDNEIVSEAKAMIERIDNILYPGLLPIANPGWDSKDLEKILKTVKSGKLDDFESACMLYIKYQNQHPRT